MLLTDRRIALVNVALAGMETLWFALFFRLFWDGADGSIFQSAGWLFFGALAWMLVVDLASLLTSTVRAYRGWILGALVVSTPVLIRGIVYAHVPLGETGWLSTALDNVLELDGGLRPEAVLLWTNVFLWLRASWSTNRNLTSLGVANSFKTGFLLLLVGGVWSQLVGKQVPVAYVPLYLAAGLIGITIARSDEQASRAATEGRRLPLSRLGQFFVVVAAFLAAGVLVNRYLPGPINAALGWLLVVAEMGLVVLQVLLVLAAIIGAELGRWLGAWLGLMPSEATTGEAPASLDWAGELQRRLEAGVKQDIVLPPLVLTLLRYLPLAVLLIIVGLAFWFVVRRVRHRTRRFEVEREDAAPFAPGDMFRRAVTQLRDLAGMAKRFGVSRQLLAAISVQNIYANVSRIAARRGHPRPPSMPPDDYLPILIEVFEGSGEALTRITRAYMQVHYGDRPVSAHELARLRLDYQTVRQSRPVRS